MNTTETKLSQKIEEKWEININSRVCIYHAGPLLIVC